MDPIVPGRSCAGCTLCCKVLSITELQKAQGTWCKHCEPARGCKIYDTRPKECRSFYCGYLTQANLDDKWKPSRSKIILVAELGGNRITAHVDPTKPNAWRDEPFYSQLKNWAIAAVSHRGQVCAAVGKRTTVILPQKDVDLGVISDDERIITSEKYVDGRLVLNALKLHKNDPRLSPDKSQETIIAHRHRLGGN